MFKVSVGIISMLCALGLEAQPTIQELMIQDIETVRYQMNIKYAPKEWKNEYLGWTVDGACQEAKDKIILQQVQTAKEFQKVFKSLLSSPRDYHVKPLFYSTEWSYFPIGVKNFKGRYYFSSNIREFTLSPEDALFFSDMDTIDDPEQYNEALSSIEVGDELIALDGVPIADLIEKIIDEQLGGNRTPTGYGLAERSLFFRMGKYGDTVPKGFFEITVCHSNATSPKTYQFPWVHVPEWIMNKSIAKTTLGALPIGAQIENFLKRDFTVHYADDLLAVSHGKLDKHKQGNSPIHFDEEEEEIDHREKGCLPSLGRVVWESKLDNELYAYLYRNRKGQNIGYIYLRTFNYASEDAEEAMEQLIEVLKYFNKHSDGLVLDITNNPGGNLFYMYGVLSALTNAPMMVPMDKEILIQHDVYRAAVLNKIIEMELKDAELDLEGQTLSGYPCTLEILEGVKDYTRKIIDSWESGKTLTDPLYVFGIEEIMPHPEVQYTKPILLLVNELDFSCADFFPAILQDNKRAVIFGKGTAGAGGYVLSYEHPSRFGVMGYTLTGSIAYRPGGELIENLGVTPDVPYDLTENDIRRNFVDYVREVNRQLDQMIK